MQPEMIGSSDGELPIANPQTVRTLSIDGITFVVIYDLARCLEVDRDQLIRRLRGRARLVTAIDFDGVIRNLVIAPVEAFFAKKPLAKPRVDGGGLGITAQVRPTPSRDKTK